MQCNYYMPPKVPLGHENINFIYNRLFCCNHTCYCVSMVVVKSVSRYVTSASRYQSRSSMYVRGLIPRNSTELAKAVPIDRIHVLSMALCYLSCRLAACLVNKSLIILETFWPF